MKKNWKWKFAALVAGFALLQLTNPARTNPPLPPGGDISTTNPPPPHISAMLHASCYDCHSYETKWPWTSRIAPASWLIVRDVNDGRERLNFSDWPHAHPDWAAKRLEHMSEELGYKTMPPPKYLLMHPEAHLTDAQREELVHWADDAAAKLKAAAGGGN